MVPLHTLWLPILLSGVVVFIVSSLVHMVLPWHRKDYHAVPDQDKVMSALRPFSIAPGDYILPLAANMKEMRTREFMEKYEKGPVMVLTVHPNGPPGMAKNLALWFVYSLVVSFFAAYVAGRALPHGAAYLPVFRFVGVSAFLAYSVALWQMSIWYGRGWGMTIKSTIDGFIYACCTAGVFGWLWPR